MQAMTGNIAVIQRALERVPHRRFAEQRGRGHFNANLGNSNHQTTAMSSFIDASKVSPGATTRNPCAEGSAMWIALDT